MKRELVSTVWGEIQKRTQKVKKLKRKKLHPYRSADRKKMLKMKDDPTMSMKTQDTVTNCPSKNTAFCTKMHPWGDNQQESKGRLG